MQSCTSLNRALASFLISLSPDSVFYNLFLLSGITDFRYLHSSHKPWKYQHKIWYLKNPNQTITVSLHIYSQAFGSFLGTYSSLKTYLCGRLL